MILFNYYYFGLFLIVHTKYLFAYQCYECNGISLNYTVTIDNIPSPNTSNCAIVSARDSCSVRVAWFSDGKSEVYYSRDQGLPTDSIWALIERKVVAWSGQYTTGKFIIYTCNTSNTEPCNNVENLKRTIISTIFPTDEQIEKFDLLIVPTTYFDGRTCVQVSNMTDCPQTNLVSCQQCMGIIEYSDQLNICAMCPSGKAIQNFLEYSTTFLINNETQSDTIKLGCTQYGGCNSIENLRQIKNKLITKFDFHQFYHSTATISKSSMFVLFIMFIPKLFHLL
jgi:hypothetical protein